MSKLLELRDAAKACSNVDYRFQLRSTADRLQAALGTLYTNPTDYNMTRVNCLWTSACRLLANVPPEGNPAPVNDAVDAEPMRTAA